MEQVDGVQAAFSNAAEAVRRLLETLQQTQQTNQHTPENIVRCIVTQLQPIMTPELISSTEFVYLPLWSPRLLIYCFMSI